ncbi:hypothetical protein DI09_16p150 [Mitosporidium daphniae]|uniref:PCI domain-containing protein n=1 Tax=Mitosporidium daphniae TaxID=1485682 RepID=A0A098VXJ7_9MICR|nr:uncharacterized protein DI09_16p150 [Mitosporidium daphniae]KGG52461.1 hypothetical protein DI09_16p150 [Mitosporidium daphniae]|eukprot:XP_013238888.1 uncharacterized protein DI09_16p150 [Mitosporidium daphniae]
MQAAFFDFQQASGHQLASFYDPFSVSKVPAEISKCLLELESGFAIPPVLQIFSSSTYAPEGSDPSSYKEFILIYTMWYVHVKFFYQSPLYRLISEASLLSASEWSAKYGQFLSPANKALASGSLLLIVRVLLDSLSTILKRLASGSENSNLYAQIKSLSRTIQLNRLETTSSDNLLAYFNYLQGTYPMPSVDSVGTEDSDDNLCSLESASQRLYEIEAHLLREYCKLLSKIFSITINDRSLVSSEKQSVTLFSGAALLEFYAKLSRTRMCTPVFRSIENSSSTNLNDFPTKDRVYWYFNRARLFIVEANYFRAKENLANAFHLLAPQFSFKMANSSRFRNFLKITCLLLPLEYFYSNKVLSPAILSQIAACSGSNSTCFSTIRSVNAFLSLKDCFLKLFSSIKNGDIISFSVFLSQYESVLQSRHLYQLFVFLFKPMLLANFTKKIEDPPENRLPISHILTAIAMIQKDLSRCSDCAKSVAWTIFPFLDTTRPHCLNFEVEALISMLISNGLIKGYLHHEKRVLVLSKVNPFPPSSSSSYMMHSQ